MNCAGTTLSDTASKLGPGQSALLTDYPKQGHAFSGIYSIFLSINSQTSHDSEVRLFINIGKFLVIIGS
jgi:hypothetical protein